MIFRRPIKSRLLREVGLLFLLAVVVGHLSGCGSDDQLPNDGLSVENLRLIQQLDGSQSVTGVVRNESAIDRSTQLEIALYDETNQRIGEVQVPVNNVPAGSIKGFDWTLDQQAEGARIRTIHH